MTKYGQRYSYMIPGSLLKENSPPYQLYGMSVWEDVTYAVAGSVATGIALAPAPHGLLTHPVYQPYAELPHPLLVTGGTLDAPTVRPLLPEEEAVWRLTGEVPVD